MSQAQQQPVVVATTTPSIDAIVDDDPHVSRALGMWLDLHGVHTTHHISAESMMQALH